MKNFTPELQDVKKEYNNLKDKAGGPLAFLIGTALFILVFGLYYLGLKWTITGFVDTVALYIATGSVWGWGLLKLVLGSSIIFSKSSN